MSPAGASANVAALKSRSGGQDFSRCASTVWQPRHHQEHCDFLGILQRLAQPQGQATGLAAEVTTATEESEAQLRLQIQRQQKQLLELREELRRSKAHCRQFEEARPASSTSGTPLQQRWRSNPEVFEPSEPCRSPPPAAPPSAPASPSRQRLDVMAEVDRIASAKTPAEVLNISEDADGAAMQKAWKQLVFALHPDKIANRSDRDMAKAAQALQSVHQAKEDFRESSQASGEVDVPSTPSISGRPSCTRNVPGQRRFECQWEVPETHDAKRPVEKYEVYGPRIFSHEGEPMEWVLLATLPRLEGCFIFVEESPTQQEVMWAGDRVRSPTVPLTVYAINGRGRSEALYFHLPWQNKFPWLQGRPCMICKQCCTVQPRPVGNASKFQCSSCDAWIAPSSASVVVNCPKCNGEALWDNPGLRLDCRCCGFSIASVNDRKAPRCIDPRSASQPPLTASPWSRGQAASRGSNGGREGWRH